MNKLRQNAYNLIYLHLFESRNPKTKFRLHGVAYRASQLWKNVLEEVH